MNSVVARIVAFSWWVEGWCRRRPGVAVFVLSLVVALPGVVAVGSNLFLDWHPTGDMSLAELMMRGIPDHPPLVGVAARVGRDINDQGYKPGPSMAYVLYPVYLVLGRSSIGVVVSTLVVHVAGIWGTLATARRWFGWRLVLPLALGLGIMVRSLAPEFFLEPWNTWIPVFAYPLFIVLLAGVMSGRIGALPFAVAVGYHCFQTHISYVPLVVSALAAVGTWVVVSNWRTRAWVRPLAWSAVVTFVMWLPPVIEQLQPGRGNLKRVWEHFTNPPSDTVGLRVAARAMAGEMNLRGPVVVGTGRVTTDPVVWWGFVLFVVVVVVGVAVWWRRRDTARSRTLVLMGGTTLVGFYATSRVFGTFYEYVIRWMWALTVMWLAWVAWVLIASVSVPVRRRMAIGIGTAILGVATAGAVTSAGAEFPYRSDSRLVATIGSQLEARLGDRDGEEFMWRWHDPASLGGTGFGMVLEMEKRGVVLKVDDWAKATVRPYRSFDESEADGVLWWVVGEGNISRFAERSDAVKLAEYDPRSPAEKIESDDLRARIEARMEEIGHPEWIELLDSQYGHTQVIYNVDAPQDLKNMVGRYNDLRLPGAVFEVPVGSPFFR